MKPLKDIQTSKWSIVGVLFGIVMGLLSSVRYFIIYEDIDRFLWYGLIAGSVIGISWCYNEIKQIYRKIEHQENVINAIEDKLDEILNEDKK